MADKASARLLPFSGIGIGFGFGIGCGVGIGAGVGTQDFTAALAHRSPPLSPTRLAARISALTPVFAPTYSLPSAAAAPPAAPYGVYVPSRTHASSGGSCETGLPSVKSRAEYLELARRLLHEPPGAPPARERQLAEVANRATVAVRFTWEGDAAARSVYLAGSFNGWGLPVAMTSVADRWECVLRLAVGEFWYKFVVDGEWSIDRTRRCEVVEGHGIANRLIIEPMDTG